MANPSHVGLLVHKQTHYKIKNRTKIGFISAIVVSKRIFTPFYMQMQMLVSFFLNPVVYNKLSTMYVDSTSKVFIGSGTQLH